LLASNQNLKTTQNQALDVWIKNIHIFNRSKAKSSKGWAYFEYASHAIDLEILIDGQVLKEATHQIYTGALRKSASAQIKEQKSFHWIWQIFLIQLFLVAFPEEIFYRGYLQSRLDQMIGKDQQIFGVWVNLQSILLCSALFAIAHLLTIPNLARLSVFFPSLLFGWMRRADQSVVPVAIFHALCNLFSQFLWGFY
jgi:membrane protease YdiL (CAAX protease family)